MPANVIIPSIENIPKMPSVNETTPFNQTPWTNESK
jgi:hypothetical protein